MFRGPKSPLIVTALIGIASGYYIFQPYAKHYSEQYEQFV